jgi:hypothetical protein
MNKHITITQWLQKLRDSYSFDLIDDNAICKVRDSITYIEPELEVKIENTDKPFIIISAPGAVGKTTFAKYAANKRKGYYWDLSKKTLGHNTFSGAILEAFGQSEVSKVLNAISKGDMTLFIDSFDEAEIVSGWSGIEKFLSEVVKYTKTSSRSNIIMFARSETAFEIQMTLEEIGGADCYSVYQIDYFSEEQAIGFIENRILQKGSSNHSKFRDPFVRTVKSIFKTIGLGINDKVTNLWDEQDIRCFLGYSPVLQTIGDFLYEQNYEEVEKEFQSKQNVESGLEIITNFISQILERDSSKFVSGLKEAVTAPKNWNEWDSIYTPEDQIKFVLNHISRSALTNNVSSYSSIPPWLEKGFQTALKAFIANHPFVRDSKFSSPAFRDYVFAKMITDASFEKTCLKLINSGEFVLTPLFSFFYKKFYNNICRANHAGFIYESVSARTSFDGNSLLTYVRKGDQKTIFEIINSSGSKADNVSMECTISETVPLTFLSKLSNASIEVDSDVVLGRKGGSFEVQRVEIFARKIIVNAKEFIAICHDETNSILVADEIICDDYSLAIQHKGNGQLIVNGNGARNHPWAQYFKEYDKSSIQDIKEELYLLKRILEPFRKHKRGEFAKQFEFVDNEIIKNIPERIELLNYLIASGVITKGAERKYYMHEEISKKFGISYSGLMSLEANADLLKFLSDFKKKTPAI